MKEILEKSIKVIYSEGILKFCKKMLRNISNNIKRIRYISLGNNAKLKALKNKYINQRIFLIGNGPSLNITPLYLLKNEYTIAFNRFNLMFERLDWYPSFYLVVDSVVARDIASEINNITPIVSYAFFPDVHTDGTVFKKFITSRENIVWVEPYFKGFHTNLPKFSIGGSVAYAAIQILIFLGFKEIYLIGVDMNYELHLTAEEKSGNTITSKFDDDPNHFDSRYFGKNRSYHQPNSDVLRNIFSSFEMASKNSKKYGVKIINAGYNSAVACFPCKDFTSLFNYSYKEILNLFLQSMGIDGNFESLEQALPNLTEIHNESEWNDEDEYLLVDVTIAKDLIKSKISSHIPYGPYENKFIFKKRAYK